MRQLHASHLSHAVRQRARYPTPLFNLDWHPFKAVRSAIRVRAKNGYLSTSDLITDGSCSLPSSQPTSRDVRKLFSSLSDTCVFVLASASARIAEHFRQLLDPMISASGTDIAIEGLGGRLARDTHDEPDALSQFSSGRLRHPPFTLPWAP
jgi:hypothetical protein